MSSSNFTSMLTSTSPSHPDRPHIKEKHPTVERLEPWSKGPTCSFYSRLQAQNRMPREHAPVVGAGATKGQEDTRARLTGLDQAGRPPNCSTSNERNCYRPLEKIRSIYCKVGDIRVKILGRWPRRGCPAPLFNLSSPVFTWSYVNRHTSVQEVHKLQHRP